jgi:hypothetical protein
MQCSVKIFSHNLVFCYILTKFGDMQYPGIWNLLLTRVEFVIMMYFHSPPLVGPPMKNPRSTTGLVCWMLLNVPLSHCGTWVPVLQSQTSPHCETSPDVWLSLRKGGSPQSSPQGSEPSPYGRLALEWTFPHGSLALERAFIPVVWF